MKQTQSQAMIKKAEAADFQMLSAFNGKNVILETGSRTYLAKIAEVGKQFIGIEDAFRVESAYGLSAIELAKEIDRQWGDREWFGSVIEGYDPKATISCSKVERIVPFDFDLSYTESIPRHEGPKA